MKAPFPGPRVKSDSHPISIIYRFLRRVRLLLELYFPKLWISRMMLIGVGAAVNTEAGVNKRLNRFAANCPFADVDFSELFSLCEQEHFKKKANDILQHRFNLLGSGLVFLGRKIHWHRDFVTGFQWDSSQRYSEARKHTPAGSDIKRPWELSRCHHLIPLGFAWRVHAADKYLDEYVSEIVDWIDRNPVGFGVNWACPMDVAIRAVNWLSAYALFCPALSGESYLIFRKKLTSSMWMHARFIRSHLEWNGPFSERRANHFLADITGLFTLGIFFSDTKLGRRWLKFSQRMLEIEIQRQVLKDGVHFECSTSYHRLCLEMFIWCYYLGLRNNLTFTTEYKKRLDAMREFSNAYTRPDGMAPLFGDNDDGRLLFSSLAQINDHRYLWEGASSDGLAVDAALLAGNHLSSMKRTSGLRAFGEAGFYILRYPDVHLIVRAGRMAHLGLHAHCDQLSFELSVKGFPVFIDRGSYVYTPDPIRRNLYRSTKAHNVLSLNRAEQNRTSGRVYGLMDDTRTEVLDANDQEIMARHIGFKTLKRIAVSQTRVFRIAETERTLEIFDIINSVQDADIIEWFFHLSPEMNADCLYRTVHVKKGSELICSMKIPEEMQVRKERFDHSPSYGRLQEAETLVFRVQIEGACSRVKARFLINW